MAPRVHTGELVSTTAALTLLITMAALDWFGAVGPAGARRSGITSAETAWSTLSTLRWLLLLTALLALGSTILHGTQRGHGSRTDTGRAIFLAGGGVSVLLAWRVLISPPHPSAVVDVKLGAYLGLLSALAIAIGGLRSIREERQRRLRLGHRQRAGRDRPEAVAARTPAHLASRPGAR